MLKSFFIVSGNFNCISEKDIIYYKWSVLTGQRSIARSKQQAACEHEWKKIGSSFEVGTQGKQGWAQNTQEREQKDSNCR